MNFGFYSLERSLVDMENSLNEVKKEINELKENLSNVTNVSLQMKCYFDSNEQMIWYIYTKQIFIDDNGNEIYSRKISSNMLPARYTPQQVYDYMVELNKRKQCDIIEFDPTLNWKKKDYKHYSVWVVE